MTVAYLACNTLELGLNVAVVHVVHRECCRTYHVDQITRVHLLQLVKSSKLPLARNELAQAVSELVQH